MRFVPAPPDYAPRGNYLTSSRNGQRRDEIMPGEFANKVVVITGGSRGIGRAIAASFAREGAQIVLVASSQANLDAAADAIGKTGTKPVTFSGDLKDLK